MKRKNKTTKLIGIILCMILSFSGCRNTVLEEQNNAELMTTLGTAWQKSGFYMEQTGETVYMEGMNKPILHESGYYTITGKMVMGEVFDSFQDKLYCLVSSGVGEENHNTLQVHSVLEKKSESFEVTLPGHILGGYAMKLDILSENEMGILFVEETEQGYNYHCLKTDGEGKLQSSVLLKIENESINMPASITQFYIDTYGYSYLLFDRGTKLLIFDDKGELCIERVLLQDNTISCSALHMPDGSLVFYVPDQDEQRITMLWFNMPSGKQKQVAELEYSDYAQAVNITEQGDLYLLQTSALLKWNVVSGNREVLFNCIQSDLELHSIKSMEVTAEGKVLLYQSTDDGIVVIELSDEEITTDEGIVLEGLAVTDNYVKAQVAAFSRKYPDMPIVYETGSSDAEDYRNQVMAQIVSGKGPDLLWVDGADMQVLKDKGVLMDLRTLIPEETLQQIFPGVIEAGTIDGTLTGLFFDAYACTMLVNKEVWPKDSISTLEILELAKQKASLQGLICSDMTFSKDVIFSIAALSNLSNSPFIDWEEGESQFKCPEFVELLELINKYGDNPKGNMMNRVKEGEFLAYRVTIEARNLPEYSELMAEYGESCHLMGFPDDDAHQGFWPQSKFLVVNAKTEKPEVITKLFEYLLSREAQQKVTLGSIRRDIIEDSVVLGVSDGNYKYKGGDNSYYSLATKEDGSTYLKEYLEFLDNCAPMPRGYEEIEEIISSVTQEYFEGKCTAERAAELIDNRVQLYLDEQK